ncbi:M48 family metallopeptidase [Ruixingdingia sedimenti]|uniref:SprT family zinc-dependent metalloprotease n=1 Tax=Ruixingdingia sedimenti TaxID=3073604 RepID=A0ABU1F4D1_9RHOB|nr:SprT family zinc-dependent metalloprotease [Xinfangfangia sp. LG-4]MDR5651725.1 SprT family zinc-dependent metalloprotease [Xinfangfangia sp. LG-4]
MPPLPGLPEVEITLRRSARARRISLRVSSLDGRVTLTLPARARESEGMAFLRDRADWIRAALARVPPPRAPGPGGILPIEGRGVPVLAGPARGPVRVTPEGLVVPGDPALAGPRIAAFLKALARGRLASACDRHAAALGRPYSRLVLRDTRSRWGSCTTAGVLMFNWRLVMAPPEVLDYVAAHEVAHLAEMNHSPAFWAVVARLMPQHAAPRAWLRAEGNALHGWQFGPRGD